MIYFLHFKYDFHVDAERMLKREKSLEISASMVQKMYGMIPLPSEIIADVCWLRSTKLFFLHRHLHVKSS